MMRDDHGCSAGRFLGKDEQLAAAFGRCGTIDSGSKLRALQTLCEIRCPRMTPQPATRLDRL
jgi:hypothetical protein